MSSLLGRGCWCWWVVAVRFSQGDIFDKWKDSRVLVIGNRMDIMHFWILPRKGHGTGCLQCIASVEFFRIFHFSICPSVCPWYLLKREQTSRIIKTKKLLSHQPRFTRIAERIPGGRTNWIRWGHLFDVAVVVVVTVLSTRWGRNFMNATEFNSKGF